MRCAAHFLLLWLLSSCGKESPFEPTPYPWNPPEILPATTVYNPSHITTDGVELGRALFFDPLLSMDESISCASCHMPEHFFSDTEPFSQGVSNRIGDRNAPPLFNLAWHPAFFWDGRASSLEEQALQPIQHENEMALDLPTLVKRLKDNLQYRTLFRKAFGSEHISSDRVGHAIAQFEATLISANSRYDRQRRGEVEFTASELLGEELFWSEKAECFHCHGTSLWTDLSFHDIGLDLSPQDGRLAVTGLNKDRGLFKTPSLRNLRYTAPYMHDGRFATLEEVLDHYNKGVQKSPNLDPLMQDGRKLSLTPEELKGLMDFLLTLSEEPTFMSTELN